MSGEPVYQFVDTNVLVYAHDNSAGQKHGQAQELIEELWELKSGCVSIQILQEFYMVVTMRVPSPLLPNIAAGIINDLRSWRVHQPDVDDILGAISNQSRYQTSFWDSMVIESARKLGCKVLFSENFNTGQRYGDVQVVNPFEASI
jgi:predicted nucleic acid-binding protein